LAVHADDSPEIRLAARPPRPHKHASISSRLLASIVDSSDDAIIGKTLDGIITTWNSSAERVYGYPAEEVIGHSISVLIPPGVPEKMDEILNRIRVGERAGGA
jgi:PAS domain S-box-containing protein